VGHETSGFLGLAPGRSGSGGARYAVLPVPYEATVCYERGTAAGPMQVIRASGQVEFFDEELHAEFVSAGIDTYACVDAADSAAEQMRRVKQAAQPIVQAGKFLLTLGGEHGITAPLVEACAAVHGPISVLQIDAHADLRDCYNGSRHSHACVMRRVLETTDRICQVGIRSYSQEEFRDCREQAERFITPQVINSGADWIGRSLDLLDEKVYVTVDMDGLDPSIAPGVGTPEPGGLTWPQVTGLLRRVCAERSVVAADIVEVRPIPPSHVTEFLAARLAYKIIAYTQR